MSFFDYQQPPPETTWPQQERHWLQPPVEWVGGWVPWHFVLSRGPTHHVTLTEVSAYPQGVELRLILRAKPVADEVAPGGKAGRDDPMRALMSSLQSRFGIGFPDGRRALPQQFLSQANIINPEGHPVLSAGSGGGGHHGVTSQRWWLWPLPPSGPLAFVFAWPDQGAGETSVVVDGTELVDAAQRAEKLWELGWTH